MGDREGPDRENGAGGVSSLIPDAILKRQPRLTSKNAPTTRKKYMAYNETPFERINVKKIDVLKKAVKLVISVGASTIVKQIIENNVDAEKTIDKVAVPVASLAIGGAVGKIAGEYTDDAIDEIVKTWNEIKNRTSAE